MELHSSTLTCIFSECTNKCSSRNKLNFRDGTIKVIELSEEQRRALAQGYRTGKTHSYRQRCKGVLLKSEKRSSAEVAKQLGCNEVTVNIWLKRVEERSIKGLKTFSGRGRKSILEEADLEKVKEVVAEHRQKLSLAKEELEEALGKSFSQGTLKRFVKKRWPLQKNQKASAQRVVSATLQTQSRVFSNPGIPS